MRPRLSSLQGREQVVSSIRLSSATFRRTDEASLNLRNWSRRSKYSPAPIRDLLRITSGALPSPGLFLLRYASQLTARPSTTDSSEGLPKTSRKSPCVNFRFQPLTLIFRRVHPAQASSISFPGVEKTPFTVRSSFIF